MKPISIQTIRLRFIPLFGWYFLLLLFFLILFPDRSPSIAHIGIQTFILTLICGGIVCIPSHITARTLSALTFSYHLVASVALRYLNMELYGDWLGFKPIDAALYRNIVASKLDLPIIEFIQSLWEKGYAFDDFGYPILLYLCSYPWGIDWGIHVILLANVFVVSISVYLLYLILTYVVKKSSACTWALLWGMLPFSVYTSSVGLKENFFSFFVILYFYGSIQVVYLQKFKLRYVVALIVGLLGVLLSRIPVAYMLLISSFFYYLLSKRWMLRHLKWVILVSLAFSIFAIPFIWDVTMSQKGYDPEVMRLGMALKAKSLGPGWLASITNILATCIGPFPSFIADEQKVNYITLYNLTAFIKCYISFFFWYALYRSILLKNALLLSLFVFVFTHMTMLTITFYSLHDRFQWPHIPIYFLLSAWGLEQYLGTEKRPLYQVYFICITAIILVFNLR